VPIDSYWTVADWSIANVVLSPIYAISVQKGLIRVLLFYKRGPRPKAPVDPFPMG